MGTHMTNVLKCFGGIWRRSVRKISGKIYRGKTTGGGCNNPLCCIRVNQKYFRKRMGSPGSPLPHPGIQLVQLG